LRRSLEGLDMPPAGPACRRSLRSAAPAIRQFAGLARLPRLAGAGALENRTMPRM